MTAKEANKITTNTISTMITPDLEDAYLKIKHACKAGNYTTYTHYLTPNSIKRL